MADDSVHSSLQKRSKSLYAIASFYTRLTLLAVLADVYHGSKLTSYFENIVEACDAIEKHRKEFELLARNLGIDQGIDESLSLAINHCPSNECTTYYNGLRALVLDKEYERCRTLVRIIHNFPELLYPDRMAALVERLRNRLGPSVSESLRHLNDIIGVKIFSQEKGMRGLFEEFAAKLRGKDYSYLTLRYENLESLYEIGLPLRFMPSNYYALIYIDSDNASSEFLGTSRGVLRAVESSILSMVFLMEKLPTNSLETVSTRLLFSGLPVYMAGDDFLFLAPIEDTFPLIRGIYDALQKNGFRASVGIVAAHVRVPLRIVISTAYEIVDKYAKSVTIDKNRSKNSLAYTRLTSSSRNCTSIVPLDIVSLDDLYRAAIEVARISSLYARTISIEQRLRNLLSATHINDFGYWIRELYQLIDLLKEKDTAPKTARILEKSENEVFEASDGVHVLAQDLSTILLDIAELHRYTILPELGG
ncbi:hypothetical protein PYJP_06390 [Pyrofollis japonicus]|uniref:Cas10/Cmr2 second palm domain-containing protein n=1 Tax=Pyrofollis japonicus TaxID=3060460 RepID=UPI00295B613C|nr:hypothetical protein [Pyrofollis japonicus]BEP17287.1 hypothetical protein PYJP_06390 [Pyrofollis japonicus]